MEAVIGAVYLDRGMGAAEGLVHRLFDPVIARSSRLGAGLDWKTSLQELTAAEDLGAPEYVVAESGPDHQKSFTAIAKVAGQAYGEGEGRTKKEAEQQAAEAAWTAISERLAEGIGHAGGGAGRVNGSASRANDGVGNGGGAGAAGWSDGG